MENTRARNPGVWCAVQDGKRGLPSEDSTQLVCNLSNGREDLLRFLRAKDFGSVLSPRHRAERNSSLGRRFRVANLITNVDRLWRLDGALTKDLAQFGS